MPFKSKQQRKFMYAKHPEMAKEWEEKTPKGKALPKKVKKKTSQKAGKQYVRYMWMHGKKEGC